MNAKSQAYATTLINLVGKWGVRVATNIGEKKQNLSPFDIVYASCRNRTSLPMRVTRSLSSYFKKKADR